MGRAEEKKQEKRKRLLESAYECIIRRGMSGTTISEICRRAGVAKGTFYLYFDDKDDIAKALNRRLTDELIQDAYRYTIAHIKENLADNLVIMADYVINRFEADPELIKVIRHDFTWPIKEEDLYSAEGGSWIPGLMLVSDYARKVRRPVSEILSIIYCIVSMMLSVCYDAIIEHNPSSMNAIRPILHQFITTMSPPQ